MTSRTLASGDDHNGRVRAAEAFARHADMTRGDLIIFMKAFRSLEQYFRDSRSPFTFDSHTRESLNATLAEQKDRCEVPRCLFDNIVSRYDRFLDLVSYLHPHANWRNIQKCFSC